MTPVVVGVFGNDLGRRSYRTVGVITEWITHRYGTSQLHYQEFGRAMVLCAYTGRSVIEKTKRAVCHDRPAAMGYDRGAGE